MTISDFFSLAYKASVGTAHSNYFFEEALVYQKKFSLVRKEKEQRIRLKDIFKFVKANLLFTKNLSYCGERHLPQDCSEEKFCFLIRCPIENSQPQYC